MTDTARPIHTALADVMREVTHVGKTSRNSHFGFRFRGIDDVLNALGPAMRRHGIVPMPEVLDLDVTTTGNARLALVTVRYTFTGPAGDSLTAVVVGEASDQHDKLVSKAMSVAYRTALLQVFALPTDEPDPDATSYNVVEDREPADGEQQTPAPAVEQVPRPTPAKTAAQWVERAQQLVDDGGSREELLNLLRAACASLGVHHQAPELAPIIEMGRALAAAEAQEVAQ